MTINSLDENNICTENIIENFNHSNNDKIFNGLVDAENKLFQLIQAFIYTCMIPRMYLL